MKDYYMERWERLRTLDSLSEDERRREINKYDSLVRKVVASNSLPREIIKALRLTFDVLDRNGPRIRWLRKGVYRLGLGELLCSREREVGDSYETWVRDDWEWRVLRKMQPDDDKPYARWFVAVKPPEYDTYIYGEVYAREIKKKAHKLTPEELKLYEEERR